MNYRDFWKSCGLFKEKDIVVETTDCYISNMS